MSKLDLNTAEGFATNTMSLAEDTGALLAALRLNRDEWEIEEGSYKGGRKGAQACLFHVFKSKRIYDAGVSSITDKGGRRKAKYSFPYTDGQTTDDLGRRGNEFDIAIMLHGKNYKFALALLEKELNDPIPGLLVHPVMGIIQCGMESIERVHSHDAKNAVALRISFTEHNFDTFDLSNEIGIPSTRSALQSAIAALQQLSATIAAVKQIVGLVTSTVNGIANKIDALASTLQDLLADSASSYGLSSSDVAAVLPVNVGGSLNAQRTTFGSNPTTTTTAGVGGTSSTTGNFVRVSDRFSAIVAPNDPFANLPINLLGDVARQAIEQTQLERRTEQMRADAASLVADIDAALVLTQSSSIDSIGRAAAAVNTLIDAKLSALRACDSMAGVLGAGAASGRPRIISYTVPRTMSIREAAFINGLTPQDGVDISLLNPFLESVNNIERGTVIKVPVYS